MKQFFLITLLMLVCEVSSHAGWFTHDDHQHEQQLQQQLDHEQQRGEQLRQQYQHEQQQNRELLFITFALGIGCIGSFLAGTMIGSKTRRESNEK